MDVIFAAANTPLGALATVAALAVAYMLLPARFDPAMLWKESQQRPAGQRATHLGAPTDYDPDRGYSARGGCGPDLGAVVRVYQLDGCMAETRTPMFAGRVIGYTLKFLYGAPKNQPTAFVILEGRYISPSDEPRGRKQRYEWVTADIHYCPERGWEILR